MDFIKTIRKQEILINSVKTIGALTNTVGACLLFTQYFPLGGAFVAGSSVGLLLTNLGEFIADLVRESQLDEMIKEDEKYAKKLLEDFKEIDGHTEFFVMKKITIDKEKENVNVFVAASKGLGFISGGISAYKPMKVLLKSGTKVSSAATKKCLGAVSRSLGVLSADMSILDCINSCLTVNPNRKKAEKAKATVEDSLKQLEELQRVVDGITSLRDGA